MTDKDDRVMHAEVKIGDSIVMMGGAREVSKAMIQMLYIYLPDVDEAYQRAMDNGGSTIQEPKDEFYGDRIAAVTEPQGNMFWMATSKEQLSQEELQKRAKEL